MQERNEAILTSPAFRRLVEEDAVGQLRRRDGHMAELGSEDGALKLDWVEGVARLLTDQSLLEEVENEARAVWQHGIRHLIWAGMGGSVITVRVLAEMGFCNGKPGEQIAIYPLDSTDPAALNAILKTIAHTKQLTLPAPGVHPGEAYLRALLSDVMMVGVSMGMTSEEPITHLTWFVDMLEQANLAPSTHILVMTLPGSYLDQFAHQRQAPSRPLQPDRGTGTGGRMSAPSTRVFLFPVALYLTRQSETPGQLRLLLTHAWRQYALDQANNQPVDHPFVQLAVALSDASENGACRLLLDLPASWQSLVLWIEQLMEESLGKGSKGIVVFPDQPLSTQAPFFRNTGLLHVRVTTQVQASDEGIFALYQPSLASQDPTERLAALAASFLGWQLTMALYGYLQDIHFAGQPAVENYKARARSLRALDDPLQVIQNWPATVTSEQLRLLSPSSAPLASSPAATFAHLILQQAQQHTLEYLDLTFNGKPTPQLDEIIRRHMRTIANELLGIPVKIRQAPPDYHSTEQSEMDGPPSLVSLRLLTREHDHMLFGTYNDTFLRAQAVGTWQAMIEQGRACSLLLISGTPAHAEQALEVFFTDVAHYLTTGKNAGF